MIKEYQNNAKQRLRRSSTARNQTCRFQMDFPTHFTTGSRSQSKGSVGESSLFHTAPAALCNIRTVRKETNSKHIEKTNVRTLILAETIRKHMFVCTSPRRRAHTHRILGNQEIRECCFHFPSVAAFVTCMNASTLGC